MAELLYLLAAAAIGSLIGFSPWLKYELDDPVGVSIS